MNLPLPNDHSHAPWTVQESLMRLSTPWVDLVGERLLTHEQQTVDYWRVERADSAIIVPLWRQQMILPPGTYRPGVGTTTLDFPGGRIRPNQAPAEAAALILQRELEIQPEDIAELTALNHEGWAVDSSFSSQRLFGFVALLRDDVQIDPECLGYRFPAATTGIDNLLEKLTCLQCRMVLLELAHHHRGQFLDV
jgi:8-oxo-dGTP pyrophosphatase MutT (NUDIX family)